MTTGLPPVVARIADLTAGASTSRRVQPWDARSGSTFERLEIGGARYFLKVVSYSGDWIMRVIGDRDYRTFRLWRSGLMDRTPPSIDHTVVAMALEGTGPDARLGMLMRDVGPLLGPAATRPSSRRCTGASSATSPASAPPSGAGVTSSA